MLTKSDHTKQYILETVAPIFNKNGYAATSLNDLTNATGLSKGSIYGNFKNKEELAIAAFKFTIKKLMNLITNHINQSDSPLQKLYLISGFYRGYHKIIKTYGGCPVLNVGIDANNQNSELFQNVRLVIKRIQNDFANIIKNGIAAGEISKKINAMQYAKRFDSMIQGAIFMAYTMDDEFYLKDAMDHIDTLITNELKI